MSQRSPIQLLDTITVNQIAAGEVIENAASVVKELIENALDAGADEIELETLGGGQGLIIVKDNGCGMTQEDVSLALQRHATSKIRDFSDIFSLHSFGFRGEALPSIASISRMEILSSLQEGEGVRCVIQGGESVLCEPAARRQGTTITVDSLFYNVPVRKGFQKSPHVDRMLMRKMLENRILATEAVGWSWISERSQELLVLKHQGFADRVALVMGENFMQEALEIDTHDGDVRIKGFFGSLNFHRPSRQGQRIFVNDRPVESGFISRKVGEMFSVLLPVQRYPVFVLKLYLPPAWCDFNVHPQKTEVRIFQEELVGEKLKICLSEVLMRSQQIPREPQPPSCISEVPFPTPTIFEPRDLSEDLLEKEVGGFSLEEALPPKQEFAQGQKNSLQIDWLEACNVRFLTSLGKVVLAEDFEGVYAIFPDVLRKHLFYLSLQEPQQHKSQTFLIPLTLQVTSQESQVLLLYMEELCQFGIELSQVGPQVFIIESAPEFIEEEELKAWMLLLASEQRERVGREAFLMFIRETLSRGVFSKSPRVFDASWLTLLWGLGKPERAFDGTQIYRRLLDTDFLGG